VAGRQVGAAPAGHAVDQPVGGQQAGAAAQRRLVDGGGEAAGRQGREHADEAGPGDVEPGAGDAVAPRHHGVAAEAMERPVEGAAEHRAAIGIGPDAGGAGPFVGEVEAVGAGLAELVGDGVDLRQVGVGGARQPAAAAPIGGAHERGGELLAGGGEQRLGLRAGLAHECQRAGGADVEHGDGGEGGRCRRAAAGGRVRRRLVGR
jgi:hypothetical protein